LFLENNTDIIANMENIIIKMLSAVLASDGNSGVTKPISVSSMMMAKNTTTTLLMSIKEVEF
jgi:hypothetical protein